MLNRLFLLVLLVVVAVPPTTAQDDTLIGPTAYPAGINPLTGLPVEDPVTLDRRPLIIKISNFPPFVREEQIGLNDAEIVWEHLLAGGVTRFSAVFYEKDFEKVGPVRSGRLLDFELTRIYRSLFTYSGMSQGTNEVLFGDALMSERVVGGSGPCPPLCRYPQEGLALEHTLYADTAAIRTDFAVEREANTTPDPVYGMAFSETAPEGGVPLERGLVRYRETVVEWVWDDEADVWLRFTDGEPHNDLGTDSQVRAKNVLILEEEHTEQPFVREQYWGPANFAFSVNLIGSGRVFLLRDGQLHEGEWVRETREAPLSYVDLDGNILPFAPGNTFINLVPRWYDGYEVELYPAEPFEVLVNGDTGVSMRYGPSTDYVSPDVAYPGDTFIVLGRNFDGDWLQLQRNETRAVWLPLERVDVDELDVIALPLARPTHER
jgi:hypothetical protein